MGCRLWGHTESDVTEVTQQQQQQPMQEPQETLVQSLGWEDPLEEEMIIHSSILARVIPQTEEPSGLQSIGSQSQI